MESVRTMEGIWQPSGSPDELIGCTAPCGFASGAVPFLGLILGPQELPSEHLRHDRKS